VVAQIVLQRNGNDPDLANFDINVESILSGFVKQEEYEKTKSLVTELEKQIIHLDRELKQTQEDLARKERLLRESEDQNFRTNEELRNATQTLSGSSSFPFPLSYFSNLLSQIFSC